MLCRYLGNEVEVERRDAEEVPSYNQVDHDDSAYLETGMLCS